MGKDRGTMGSYFLDVSILEKREEKKKEKYTSLDKGMYMNGKILEFHRKNILAKCSIMLPTAFDIMPQEYAQIKYPSVFRPQCIYTSADLSVNMSFSLFPDNLHTRDVAIVTNQMKSSLLKEYPEYTFGDCTNTEEPKGCWFDYRSHVMDSDMHNMMFLSIIQSSILQITFNCPFQISEDWKKVVLQMWETIEEGCVEE